MDGDDEDDGYSRNHSLSYTRYGRGGARTRETAETLAGNDGHKQSRADERRTYTYTATDTARYTSDKVHPQTKQATAEGFRLLHRRRRRLHCPLYRSR